MEIEAFCDIFTHVVPTVLFDRRASRAPSVSQAVAHARALTYPRRFVLRARHHAAYYSISPDKEVINT